jgi:dipeptidyl-peptidase-4
MAESTPPTTPPVASFPIAAAAIFPPPGMAVPNSFSFSQDDRQLTYLFGPAGDPIQQLYALDTATGQTSVLVAPPGGGTQESDLSPEEELRRQRARMLATGLTSYRRAKHADCILIPLSGDVYLLDRPGADLRLLVDSSGQPPAQTPDLSPDGEWVAFVRDAEVYVIPTAGGEPRQITHGARATGKTHGLAEYIAQEELDRADGFWWSPDSRSLLFAEVDETHIPLYRIMHQGKDALGLAAQEDHHYPFAGQPNAVVRLAVVSREGGDPLWLDLDLDQETYLARGFWWLDGRPGAVLLNRPQNRVSLLRFDPSSGARTVVLDETVEPWINLIPRPLAQLDSGGFVWASERSGFRHLYLYDAAGTLIRPLTSGQWTVDAIAGVDEPGRQIYFTGNREHPTQTQLYAVSLDGGPIRRVTADPGTHDVTLDHAARAFVDVHSALDTPPHVALRSLADGSVLQALTLPADERLAAFHLQPPELVTLHNRGGVPLHGLLYRPPTRFGPGPYPTIVHVYGGPHAQLVADSWRPTAALDLQYLRNQGFLVFRLDNRGSARRGLAFESPLRHHMGTIEVHDQVDGVHWLVAQGLADPDRVGILGWSYGGYMALNALAKAPETFKVAVAGAPVSAWDGYDTAYTERYMGTPQTNPDGYADSAVMPHVGNIRGKLLLVHGLLDENVHFRHTARLMNALIRARVPYDTLFFPDERHMPRRPEDRVYLQERIADYFQRNL